MLDFIPYVTTDPAVVSAFVAARDEALAAVEKQKQWLASVTPGFITAPRVLALFDGKLPVGVLWAGPGDVAPHGWTLREEWQSWIPDPTTEAGAIIQDALDNVPALPEPPALHAFGMPSGISFADGPHQLVVTPTVHISHDDRALFVVWPVRRDYATTTRHIDAACAASGYRWRELSRSGYAILIEQSEATAAARAAAR